MVSDEGFPLAGCIICTLILIFVFSWILQDAEDKRVDKEVYLDENIEICSSPPDPSSNSYYRNSQQCWILYVSKVERGESVTDYVLRNERYAENPPVDKEYLAIQLGATHISGEDKDLFLNLYPISDNVKDCVYCPSGYGGDSDGWSYFIVPKNDNNIALRYSNEINNDHVNFIIRKREDNSPFYSNLFVRFGDYGVGYYKPYDQFGFFHFNSI